MDEILCSQLKGLINWSNEHSIKKQSYEEEKRVYSKEIYKKSSFHKTLPYLENLNKHISGKQLPLKKYRLRNFEHLNNLVKSSSTVFEKSAVNPVMLWVKASSSEVSKIKTRINNNLLKQQAVLSNINEKNYPELVDTLSHLLKLEEEHNTNLKKYSKSFVGHSTVFMDFVHRNYFKKLDKISNSAQFLSDHHHYFSNALKIGLAAEYTASLHNLKADKIKVLNRIFLNKLNC